MSKNIDINSPEWCNIVFEGKNKDYGAYELRQLSPRWHIKSLIIVIILFIAALLLPRLIESVIPERKERMVDVTSLADLKIEQPKVKDVIIISAPPPPPLKSSIRFTPPVIKPDQEVMEEDEVKTQESLNEAKIAISVADVKGTDEDNGVDIASLDENQAITQEDETKVFEIVQQMPEFPGGENALVKWINEHIKYPYLAAENGIEGKVYVQFVVDKDGNISNARIARSIAPSLDQEALRVVNNLPRWNPGKQSGQPVRVSYTIPINFVLKQ
jgi:periplasmic protein TonB